MQWEGEHWDGHDSWEPINNLTTDMRQEVREAADEATTRQQRTVSAIARRKAIKHALKGRRLIHTHGLKVGTFKDADGSSSEEEARDVGGVRRSRILRDEEDRVANSRRRRRGRRKAVTLSESEGGSDEGY